VLVGVGIGVAVGCGAGVLVGVGTGAIVGCGGTATAAVGTVVFVGVGTTVFVGMGVGGTTAMARAAGVTDGASVGIGGEVAMIVGGAGGRGTSVWREITGARVGVVGFRFAVGVMSRIGAGWGGRVGGDGFRADSAVGDATTATGESPSSAPIRRTAYAAEPNKRVSAANAIGIAIRLRRRAAWGCAGAET